MIEAAQANARRHDLDLRFLVAPAEHFPFEAGSSMSWWR